MQVQGESLLPPPRASAGTFPSFSSGAFGEVLESRYLPDYYTMVKSGQVFSLGGLAANPTAFTGGAAGTPLIGIFNPANSGKDLVLLEVAVGIRTSGTAAVADDFNHFLGAQGAVAPTGTQTQARQLYSGVASGSIAYGMVNTANTGAPASNLVRPSISVGLTAATAITNVQRLIDELKGLIIVAPGNYYAFGAAASLTAASIDVAAVWAEVAV